MCCIPPCIPHLLKACRGLNYFDLQRSSITYIMYLFSKCAKNILISHNFLSKKIAIITTNLSEQQAPWPTTASEACRNRWIPCCWRALSPTNPAWWRMPGKPTPCGLASKRKTLAMWMEIFHRGRCRNIYIYIYIYINDEIYVILRYT